MTFTSISDTLESAKSLASEAQDDILQTRILAQLGFVYYKCFPKGSNELQIINKARKYFQEMNQLAGQASLGAAINSTEKQNAVDGDDDDQEVCMENWYFKGQNLSQEVILRLEELEKANLTAEEIECNAYA